MDEFSPEYLALHPTASKKQPSLIEEHFEPVQSDEELGMDDSDTSKSPQLSDDEINKDKRKNARIPRSVSIYPLSYLAYRVVKLFWIKKQIKNQNKNI